MQKKLRFDFLTLDELEQKIEETIKIGQIVFIYKHADHILDGGIHKVSGIIIYKIHS